MEMNVYGLKRTTMLQKQGSIDIYCINSPISMQMSADTIGCCKTLLWWKYAFCFSCAVQTFFYEISWWQASGILPPGTVQNGSCTCRLMQDGTRTTVLTGKA